MNIKESRQALKKVDEKIDEVKSKIEQLKSAEDQDLEAFRELKTMQEFLNNLENKKNSINFEIEKNEKKSEQLEEEYSKAVEDVKKLYKNEAEPFLEEFASSIKDLGAKYKKIFDKLSEKTRAVNSIVGKIYQINGKTKRGHSTDLLKCSEDHFKAELREITNNNLDLRPKRW